MSLTKTDRAHSRSLKDSNLGHLFSSEYNHDFSLIWNLINMETDSLNFVPTNWSDFHETIASLSDTSTRTEIGYGPFVPSSPTNVEVVEHSIDYCSKVAQHLNQTHVVITVDEAIYEIVYGLKTKFPQKYKNVIPRMGGFHICLNFLGAIGRIMSKSGTEDILVDAKIFLRGTVNKIISGGKDYYKMIRAHTLVQSAMFELYWEQFSDWLMITNDIDCCDVNSLSDEIENLRRYLREERFDMIELSYANICSLVKSIEPLKKRFEETFKNNPTALFWLQYINMICILQWYIMAERSGDWNQHLLSVERMLPFMVSAGHYKYVSLFT